MKRKWMRNGLACIVALSMMVPVSYAPKSRAAEPQGQMTIVTETPKVDTPEFVPGHVAEKYELVYPKNRLRNRAGSEAETMPSFYDTRDTYQTPVKNQGSNGICWAFGASATVEANIKKNGIDSNPDLSEQHMAYATSGSCGNDVQGWVERTPDGGGNRYISSSYLMRGTTLSGTVNESVDPYVYGNGILKDRGLSETQSKNKEYTVKNLLFMTGFTAKPSSVEVAAIKEAIMKYGGVNASMYWQGSATASGAETGTAYFNESTASYYFDGDIRDSGRLITNHEVEIVGWDDNYAIENFNSDHRPAHKGAWLIKNSWGIQWGDLGYAWISYDDTNFPLNTMAVDRVEKYDSKKYTYETDYKFDGSSVFYDGKNVKSLYEAKTFEVNGTKENLISVRLFVYDADTTVSVDYIVNFNGFTNYSFSEKAKKYFKYPGWYTIDLPGTIDIGEKGSKFAIVIKKDSTNEVHIPFDDYNSIKSGVAFLSESTATLSSEAEQNQYRYNLCIKAVTERDSGAAAAVDEVAKDLVWGTIKGENDNING